MKLLVLNGSPKTGPNNTAILLNQFITGVYRQPENSCRIVKLNKLEKPGDCLCYFEEADTILFAFPLYIHSMPTIVKEFIESLEFYRGRVRDKKFGFLVQYGLPEAIHGRALECYLKAFTLDMGAEYLGTILKGSCNSLAVYPSCIRDPILKGIYKIGYEFGKTGEFNHALLRKYAGRERLTIRTRLLARLYSIFVNIVHWNKELRSHGVRNICRETPYAG